MRALVTGSAGFLGSHFATELVTRGWDVQPIDTVWNGRPTGFDALQVFDSQQLPGQRFDLVVHAAAVAPHRAAIDGRPATLIRNQLLDAAMFDWAVRTGQDRVLYLSSCAALDAEPDAYGLLKLTGERMAGQARAAGLPVTVVRPYSGYGEDQGTDWPFGAFLDRARRLREAYQTCTDTDAVPGFEIWGDGEQVRDWIHVDDVVRGALAVAESGTEEPVSLCTGIGTSMFDLACLMCDEVGVPRRFAFNGDRPAGAARRVGDPSAMLRYYRPQVSIEEGVRRALAREGAVRGG